MKSLKNIRHYVIYTSKIMKQNDTILMFDNGNMKKKKNRKAPYLEFDKYLLKGGLLELKLYQLTI